MIICFRMITGDTIVAVGDLGNARGKTERDVHGQTIAPGFINMMSEEWGLFGDGRSQSDIRQGVTLEIRRRRPLNDALRAEYEKQESDIHYDVTWHTRRSSSIRCLSEVIGETSVTDESITRYEGARGSSEVQRGHITKNKSEDAAHTTAACGLVHCRILFP